MFFRSRAIITYALAFSLTLLCPCLALGQTEETVGDGEVDPIKLFERGQDAHARGNLQLAAQLYEEAIKLQPEFPEAEYQRATALVSLDRAPEAEKAFRRAIELRSDWALPAAALGALLVRLNRPDEAEKYLTRALELDAKSVTARVAMARVHAQAGRREEALRALDALDEETKALPETIALRNAILTGGKPDAQSRAALEKILKSEPRNAALLARLGALYRTDDPLRAVEYYARALEIEPRSVDYATGYGAALVQARRYQDAVAILRQVLAVTPDNYVAHANLAAALYELKSYMEALKQFEWLVKAKPDIAATYFFIATAHDNLGEYDDALASYERFLARADAQKDQTEIEKVNLRLPSLRAQIKRGEGKKKKDRQS